MKRLLFVTLLVLLLLSGCISKEEIHALKGADFIEGDAVLCEIEPYTILFGSNTRSSTSSNIYGELFDHTQFKDSDVNPKKEYSFENQNYSLNYLITNFVNTLIEYSVIDYYYNDEKNMLFGFKRDNDMLVLFRRLTTDSKPEDSPLNKVELEAIIDQKMYDLSGQTGYKKTMRNNINLPGKGNYMGIYTFMLGDYATQKKILVTVDSHGELIEYRWCSDFYGDLSTINENNIDFTKIEDNTKLRLAEEFTGCNLDTFEFSNKQLYFLLDGTLCVEYIVSFNKTNLDGKFKEIKSAFSIIDNKRNGTFSKNNKIKLKSNKIYKYRANEYGCLISDIDLGSKLKNYDLSYLNDGLHIIGSGGIPNQKQNMMPKTITIDNKEIEVPYNYTVGYVDNNYNIIKSDSYQLKADNENYMLFLDFIDDKITSLYLQYKDKKMTLDELRLKAEKMIKDNFDIDGFKYEYEVYNPEGGSVITYSKMLGDFYTTTVRADLRLGCSISIKFTSVEADTKALDVDLEAIKSEITDKIIKADDKASNIKFAKIFLDRVFETSYISFWVSYDTPSPDIEGKRETRKVIYYYTLK